MPRSLLVLATSLALGLAPAVSSSTHLSAQSQPLRPVTVGSPMPDFTLPSYQGDEITLSARRGKNVMIVFPRGHSRPGSWCHICPYQHSEFVEYDEETEWQARANLEILYVLPYSREEIGQWLAAYPQLLQDNENAKNPHDPEGLDEAGRARMMRAREIYPKVFSAVPGQVPTPFPLLVDGTERAHNSHCGRQWRASVQVHEPEHGGPATPGVPDPGGGYPQRNRRRVSRWPAFFDRLTVPPLPL